jgi:ketosteroid isomerase-like protein
MYHAIVKRIIRSGYSQISRADFDSLLKVFDPHIHFTFSGQHAMTGDFHNRETVRQWFERVHRFFPHLQIEAQHIVVSGMPWNTWAAVQFTVRDTLPDGTPYLNHGTQFMRIVWGKVVEDHLIEDTQILVKTLRCLSDQGLKEASSPALQDG